MNREVVSTLASVMIAMSTFVGVGAAIAYYLVEVTESSILYIILAESLYFLFTAITLVLIKRNIN